LANNVNLGGTLTLGGSNALTLSGVVAGIGGLVKNGAADLILNGANSYFGNTALNNAGDPPPGAFQTLASDILVFGGGSNCGSNNTYGKIVTIPELPQC